MNWFICGIAMLIAIMFSIVSAITINPPVIPRDFTSDGTYYHNSGGNCYFAVNNTMSFSKITIDDFYVAFNSTGFNVSSAQIVNVSISNLDNDLVNSSEGSYILGFYVHSNGMVWFNLSGFNNSRGYLVYRDNIFSSGIETYGSIISFVDVINSEIYYKIRVATDYDIILDTDIDYLDASSLTSHYLDSGDPGWIRDDINDDGDVDYLDASSLTSHYLESY